MNKTKLRERPTGACNDVLCFIPSYTCPGLIAPWPTISYAREVTGPVYDYVCTICHVSQVSDSDLVACHSRSRDTQGTCT